MKLLFPSVLLFLLMANVACEPPKGGLTSDPNSPLNSPELQPLIEGVQNISAEFQEMSRPNKVQAWVKNLIVKAQPGKDMPQVGSMQEGDVAEYLYQRTVRKTEFTLRGQKYYEPWILIRTQDGLMGWVHEGGVRYMDNSFSNFLETISNATQQPSGPNMRTRGVVPNAVTAVVNPAQDRMVVPGQKVGAIRLKTDETELIRLYGPSNVARGKVNVPSGPDEDCTVVFPGGNEEIRICWKDESRNRIKAIYFDKKGSSWFTKQGLQVGLSLSELTKVNKSPLSFYGFDWKYGGTVSSWRNGVFHPYEKYFYAQLSPAPGVGGSLLNQFKGNKTFSSNDQGVEQLAVYVSRVVVYLD